MILIQILGIKDYRQTVNLKKNTQEALKALHLDVEVEEIWEVEDLIHFKISGIPALVVNGRVAFQKVVPDVDDLIKLFQATLFKKTKLSDMKRILFPTDFSAASKNALEFTRNWAKDFGADIKVIHCYSLAFDPNQPVIVEPIEAHQAAVAERLQRFVQLPPADKDVYNSAGVAVETEAILGFPVEEIIRIADDEKFDLVVMSTIGEHGMLDNLFGSVSSSVSLKTSCPVLLIPDGISFKRFSNVLYAAHQNTLDTEHILQAASLTEHFHADLHFVHVQEESEAALAIEEFVFDTLFREKFPDIAVNFSEVQSPSVIEGLLSYAREHAVDLLVFVNQQRSFWEKLLHKSATRQMALHSKLPMLVLHTK